MRVSWDTQTLWKMAIPLVMAFSCLSVWCSPARSQSEDFNTLYQEFLSAFKDASYEQAAQTMERAIEAYDAAGFSSPDERATLIYYLAEAHVRNEDAPAALQAAQMGLSQQDPALVSRYPEFNRIMGWAHERLGFYGLASGGYSQAAELGKLFNESQPGRYPPDVIAGLEYLTASARTRATTVISEKAYIEPMRAALQRFEAVTNAPAYRLQYDLARALVSQGLGFEARSLFQELASQAPSDIQSIALARLAVLEWNNGERQGAVTAAKAALALDTLHPSRAPVMRTIVILGEDTTSTERFAAARAQLDSLAQSETRRVHEDLLSSVEIIKIMTDAITDALLDQDAQSAETAAAGKVLVDEISQLASNTDLFISDAFGQRLIRDLRLQAAHIHEHLGQDSEARAIFKNIWLTGTAGTVQEQVLAQAGLGRLGMSDSGELINDLDTLSAFSRHAAEMAEFFLTQIPARAQAMQSRQIERFAVIMEQAVDAAFDKIVDRGVMGPADAPNVLDGFNQSGTYVFPWERREGSGYPSNAGSGLYAKELGDVFRQIQLARQSSAARAIAQMTSRQVAGSDALAQVLRERDRLIEKRLSILEGSSEPEQDRFARLAEVDAEMNQIETALDRDFPEYRNHIGLSPLTLPEARALLKDGETLITYMQTNVGLHIFALSTEQVIWHRAPVKGQWVADIVGKLRQALDPQGPLRGPVRGSFSLEPAEENDFTWFDLTLAHELYVHALGPIAAHLPAEETLIIAADGPLQSMPFAALVTDQPNQDARGFDRFQQASWAVRDYTFVTIPIPATMRALRNPRLERPEQGTFVGVGDPVFRYDKEWLRLSQLPETEDELRRLNDIVAGNSGTLHLGDGAHEAALSDPSLESVSVVAFATHGLMGGEVQGLSEPALALTPAQAAVSSVFGTGDGLLTVSEIAQLQLNAELVLLSACNTAQGAGGEGAEGLSGLARAFFYAGARQLVVSHWAVQSDATVELTTGMFHALRADAAGQTMPETSKIGAAEALRASMLNMIDKPPQAEWAHPGIWAPFVVVGG